MRNRRLAIVAALTFVEFWILGLMIRSVSCGHGRAPLAFDSPGQTSDGRSAMTIETGPQPRVVIDEDDATLTVSVRPGMTVAVDRGATLEKTADGVRIERPDGLSGEATSTVVDVIVPPGAQLDVENAGTTKLSGLRAAATLHSDDGSITVSDQIGALTVKTDNGRIELDDVQGPSVEVNSDNGRIVFERVRADVVAIATDNGRIDVSRSLLRGGKIQSDSGRVRLGLDSLSNVTVSAHAAAGQIVAESPLTMTSGGDDDDEPSLIRVGDGAGRLDVGSDDGSITVQAGGV